ncbi:MAG: DNA polymerase III subunit beta [Patescibacteria group bacterium]|jgi:DNA polymerase-3 subunit beta
MKFIILKENLKQGLSMVAHLTSKNINLPILNNVLIKAKKEGVDLISTNLEISINHFLRAKVEKEGDFTVDSKIINEYVSLLPEDKIEINLVNEDLNIKCQNYKTKIKGQASSDFPVLPKIERNGCYFLDINEFKTALSSVIFSVSTNENRIELSGVLFSFKNEKLTLVGTDSYRLSEKTINFKSSNIMDDRSVIVPARTVQEIIRILNNFKSEEQLEGNNSLEVCLTENQISFSFASTQIISRLIIGNYPDYQQIIPQKEATKLIINKNSFVRAIKTSGLFSKTGINDVGLIIKKNKTVLTASSSQTGENEIELDVDFKGEENDIFFNYKYFLEGLNNINSDKVILKIVNNNTPCILKADEEDDFLYLVMPIKQ